MEYNNNKHIMRVKLIELGYMAITKFHKLKTKLVYVKDILIAFISNIFILFITLILLESVTIDIQGLKNIIEICIPFIAAIIGLSIPFGVEMINKIGEKYNSTYLVDGFQNERAYKSFFASILISIFSSIAWILSDHFQINHDPFLYFPHKLLLASILLLFFCLFWFMYLIMIYYQPNKLALRYLKLNKKNLKSQRYLPMIKDLTIHSLNNITNYKQVDLLNFWAFKARSYDKETDDDQRDFYNSIYEINNAMSSISIKQFRTQKQSILFVFFNLKQALTDTTYNYIKFCILQYTFYDRIDLYKSYWEQADQYFQQRLNTNKKAISEEKEKFKDFHLMLGALLIDKEKYSWIKFMFRFTNSQPPHYYLLTNNIEETITLFMRVRQNLIWGDTSEGFRAFIDYGNEGIVGESYFFKYLQQYVALLFLRLYTLQTYYTYGDPLAEVNLPIEINEKKFWLENIEHLNTYIDQVLNNGIPELIGLPNVTYLWIYQNDKTPKKFIKTLKNKLNSEIESIQNKEPISQNKINTLKSRSTEIFLKYRTMIEKVFVPQNENDFNPTPNSTYNCLIAHKYERAVFYEDGGINHINFDSFTAKLLVDNLLFKLISQFSQFFDKGIYTLKVEDILPAIDKILMNKTKEEYNIICFSFSLKNFPETRKFINDNNDDLSYKGTNIIEMSTGGFRNELDGKICIIKTTDKPKIRFSEPDEKAKYKLSELQADSKCYYNLIKHNGYKDLSISKSEICVILATKAEVEWNNSIEAIFIKPVFGYRQDDEAPQSIDEVSPIK